MALNRGLMGTNLAFDVTREVDRVLGPTGKMKDAFESLRAIEDAMCPRALRSLIDMQRQMAAPLGILAGAQHGLSSSMSTVIGAMRVHKDLLGVSNIADLKVGLRDVLGPSGVFAQMAPFARLDRSLKALMPTRIHDGWREHLAKSAVPSLNLLEMEWQRPTGVLASVVAPRVGASLTWLDSEASIPSVAALLDEGATLPEITIDVTVTCAFCGEAMIAHECTLRWKGNRKGSIDLSVIPICPTCTRRSLEEPAYASKALHRLQAPKLRIVKPAGATDGVSRGKLHLVREDEDDR